MIADAPSDKFLRAHSHETARYYSLPGTAHYEARWEEGEDPDTYMTDWRDAGHVSPALLAELKEKLAWFRYFEIRTVVSVANADTGAHAGVLHLDERIEGGTDLTQ